MAGKKIISFIVGFGTVLVIGFVLIFLSLRFSENKSQGKAIQETAMERELTLEVNGLVCQACVSIVQSSLEGTPGILNATIELDSGHAILNYNDFVITKAEILSHTIFSGYYTATFLEERIVGEAEEYTFGGALVLDEDYRYAIEPLQKAEAKILTAIRSKEGIDDILSLLDEVESRGKDIQAGTKENNEKRIRLMLRLSSLIGNLGAYTPGNYIYPAKIKVEQVRFSLSPTVIYKAKNQFLMSDNRIKEMSFLLSTDNLEDYKEGLSEDYAMSLTNTLKFVKVAKEKGKEKPQLLAFSDLVLKEVNGKLPRHEEVLELLYGEDIPEEIMVTLDSIDSLSKASLQASVFQVDDQEIPEFLIFIKSKGWYAHTIVGINEDEKIMTVEDGIGHEFPITFEFAEMHLREHHGVGAYVDEMGLFGFLEFAMENGLYQHRMDKVILEDEVVIIKGDEGTDFETTFEMTFENIIEHMRLDHKWINQELLDANYCETVFAGEEVDNCIKELGGL